MKDYFLGIDFGTGGAKGCIINSKGDVLGYSFKEYPIISLNPGWSEHDPLLYWEICKQIVKECIYKTGINVNNIRGIAASSALPCMVLVNKSGEPIKNAYNLMDRRAVKEVSFIKNTIGENNYFKITKNRLDDHPSIVNLLWEKNNNKDIYKDIFKALTIEGFINYKLTNKFALVHQNATFVGGYDLLQKDFNEDFLKEIGIDRNVFPDLYYSNSIIGTITPQAEIETGLPQGIPVSAGQSDFNASCLASGVINEGDIQSNLGSCGNFGIIHKDENFMYEMIAFAFTVGEKDTYITVPTTATGGMSIRFIRDNFSQLEIAAEKAFGLDSYKLLDAQAEKIPPGSDGLIVLPFLNGERTPIWDANARGVVFGLSLNHNKGHLIRATMEGVAYAMFDSFKLIKESGRKINYPLIMNEGGAKSTIWRKIITDVFNTPTVLVKQRAGAPLGDAYLAAVATGYFKNFNICKDLAQYIDQMNPDEENHNKYFKYYGLYKDIYKNLKESYKKLAELRNKI